MARLFINEAAGPHGDAATTTRAMGWMKRVLSNRLAHPGQFDAPGASRLTEIIQAHRLAIQFTGFTNYPTIGVGAARNIQAKLAIASDDGDLRQPIYLGFVRGAIAAAQLPAPVDPCQTGLYFWKTAGTVSPGGKSFFFQMLDGNDSTLFRPASSVKPESRPSSRAAGADQPHKLIF